MPEYTPSSAGVELRVTNNGRPQGKGPVTQADLNSAIEFRADAQNNTPAVPIVAGGSPALTRVYRIDTVTAAGSTNVSQVHPDTEPFLITGMKVLRTETGAAADTWELQVQRQAAGAYAVVFAALAYTASATEGAIGDEVRRAFGEPLVFGEQRIAGGDVLRLVTTNSGVSSAAQCYIECVGTT